MLEQVLRRASGFDVVHFHTDTVHLPARQRPSVRGLLATTRLSVERDAVALRGVGSVESPEKPFATLL